MECKSIQIQIQIHHIAIKELGHLLTHSGLTHPEVSSMDFLGSFCFLGCSFLSVWVICYVAFDLHVASIFSCNPVFCPKLVLYLIPLQCLYLFYDLSKCIQPFFSHTSPLLLLDFNYKPPNIMPGHYGMPTHLV
jgi:hypothetical protein